MGRNASRNYQELHHHRILARVHPIRRSDNQTSFSMLGNLYQLPFWLHRPYYAKYQKIRARSQPGPRYLSLISGLNSNPPHASTIDRVFFFSMPSGFETSRPMIFLFLSWIKHQPPYCIVFHTRSSARALFWLRLNRSRRPLLRCLPCRKMMFSIDHKRLPAKHLYKTDAMITQPYHSWSGVTD